MASALLLNWTWQEINHSYQEEFLREALTVSSAFNPIAIDELGGGDGDIHDPEYLQILDQLSFVELIYPNIQTIFLLKQDENGRVFSFMETASSESQDKAILDTSVDLQEVFSAGGLITEGPVENDERSLFKLYIPLINPFSGNVIAVLGMFMDANNLNNSIKLDFELPLWTVIIFNFSILGVFIFIAYREKKREQSKMEILSRYYLVVFTGLVGICITILSVWYVSRLEKDSRREIFQRLSSAKINQLSTQLNDIDQFSLQGLEQFFLGSDFVSSEEFKEYAKALVENKLVAAWAWVPEIGDVERDNFENELFDPGSSQMGIWEVDSEGESQSAPKRDKYFPIAYIVPETPDNLKFTGLDLATGISNQSLFEDAMQTGLAVASTPFKSSFATGKEYIIVIRPVKKSVDNARQVGVVVAFVEIEKLLQVTQHTDNLSDSAIFLDFFQLSPGGKLDLVVSSSPETIIQEHVESNLQSHSPTEFTMIQPVFIYGNTYAIVTHPSSEFSKLYPGNSGIILVFSGGVLSIALMFFVNDTSGRNVILSRLVSQRTKELSESEERLRLASASVKLGVYDINTQNSKVIVNDVYAEMLGYDPSSFTETYEKWMNRLHPEDRRKTKKYFNDFMMGTISDYQAEFRLKTAEADWIWVSSTAVVVEWDEQNRPQRILGSHLDITASKKATVKITQLLDQSNRRLKRMETLREIDKAITSNYNPDKVLNLLLYEIKRHLDVDIVLVFLLDENDRVFRYAGGLGLEKVSLEHLPLSQHNSLAGKARNYGRPIHTQALEEFVDPSFLPLLKEEGIKDCFAFSLVSQGKVKGVIELWHRSVKIPNAGWMQFAETLVGQAAIAIDYSQLLSGLRTANVELKYAYDATIEGWSRAMDLKDKETEGHTQRVAQRVIELAKRIGIQGEALDHIRRGALLHDIGKMGIPDAILLKPALLTDEERHMMQKHPIYAFDMLKSIDYLRPALDIPYLHHEKWDGSGYPLGMKGEEIPISARLFALVDVFDALTNDRPYRPAWSIEKTLSYMEENIGIHFDPKIAPVFIEMIREESERWGLH